MQGPKVFCFTLQCRALKCSVQGPKVFGPTLPCSAPKCSVLPPPPPHPHPPVLGPKVFRLTLPLRALQCPVLPSPCRAPQCSVLPSTCRAPQCYVQGPQSVPCRAPQCSVRLWSAGPHRIPIRLWCARQSFLTFSARIAAADVLSALTAVNKTKPGRSFHPVSYLWSSVLAASFSVSGKVGRCLPASGFGYVAAELEKLERGQWQAGRNRLATGRTEYN